MKKLLKGNIALVEGAIRAGIDGYFGYPITPQNEITEHMSLRMQEENKVFLQAESELAAINMVYGAGLTGKKAMTSSSSPGISLMQESFSYLVGCEVPAVIINVQRGGPGLGNISGAQGDYFQVTKGGGHGDYKMIVLTPGTLQEMYDMVDTAFNLAFKYRNPVIILTDGVLGQMMAPVITMDKNDINQSNNYSEQELKWNLNGCKDREPRYIRSLYMEEGELERHNYKLWSKFKNMESECMWEEIDTHDADIILIGYGISSLINFDAYKLARNKGIKAGYFRLKTACPFPYKKIEKLANKSKFLVTELSMGQMLEDVKLACQGTTEIRFYGRPGGGIPEVNKILAILEEMK